MCTGEVERNVWMRLRSAGLIASAQRSMSFKAARDNPQITEFFAPLALSWTDKKAPPAAVDVVEGGARHPTAHGILRRLGDLVDGIEVALRGDRETRLDDVYAHGIEQLGDFDLLLVGHRRAGALLAVAQRRVEDDDAVFVGLGGGHGTGPS